jgi:hypothetical protein
MAQGLLTRKYNGRAIVAWLVQRWTWWVVGLGVLLRVVEYVRNRGFWMDEGSLAANIVGHSAFEPPAPMKGDQLAPYGFLVVERALAGVLGTSQMALRVLPFCAGMLAYWLLLRLSSRSLRPSSRSLAVVLLAVSSPLIYFTVELKPYIVDVAAACICLSLPHADEMELAPARRVGWVALMGALLVWFSFPVAFQLAGVGLAWIATSCVRRSWALAGRTALVIAAWLASFAGAYVAAKRSLAIGTGMWAFWGFAFPPETFRGAIAWTGRRLVNLFANPLHLDTPLWPTLSAVLGAVLAVLGARSFRRRDPELLVRLVVPLTLAWGVAIARVYPFHGRLLLHLVPALYLLVWEGAGLVRERPDRRWGLVWVAFLVIVPTLDSTWNAIEPRYREFSPFGDLRKNPWL